jgi:thioredoxin 1
MSRSIVLFVLLLLSPFVSAVEYNFSESEFDRLAQSDTPVLVHVHAEWCGTCNRQTSLLSELLGRREFRPFTLLRVIYDKQKNVVERFGVQYQSTLIVFRKGAEVARSIAIVNERETAMLLRMAL